MRSKIYGTQSSLKSIYATFSLLLNSILVLVACSEVSLANQSNNAAFVEIHRAKRIIEQVCGVGHFQDGSSTGAILACSWPKVIQQLEIIHAALAENKTIQEGRFARLHLFAPNSSSLTDFTEGENSDTVHIRKMLRFMELSEALSVTTKALLSMNSDPQWSTALIVAGRGYGIPAMRSDALAFQAKIQSDSTVSESFRRQELGLSQTSDLGACFANVPAIQHLLANPAAIFGLRGTYFQELRLLRSSWGLKGSNFSIFTTDETSTRANLFNAQMIQQILMNPQPLPSSVLQTLARDHGSEIARDLNECRILARSLTYLPVTAIDEWRVRCEEARSNQQNLFVGSETTLSESVREVESLRKMANAQRTLVLAASYKTNNQDQDLEVRYASSIFLDLYSRHATSRGECRDVNDFNIQQNEFQEFLLNR